MRLVAEAERLEAEIDLPEQVVVLGSGVFEDQCDLVGVGLGGVFLGGVEVDLHVLFADGERVLLERVELLGRFLELVERHLGGGA